MSTPPRHLIFIALFILGTSFLVAHAEDYTMAYVTFLGGARTGNATNTGWEHARDVVVDDEGNLYVAGGTGSDSFPVTPGAYQTTYNPNVTGSTSYGSFGPCDAFITKYDPSGKIIWCTYFGGPNYDRIYGMEFDPQGNIVVSGRAGKDLPVTSGVLQPTFSGPVGFGTTNYGDENAFVAKFTLNGALVWSTYVGVGELCRDIAVDSAGDIYVPLAYVNGRSPTTMPGAFTSAFTGRYQPARRGGNEIGVAKIKSDGTQILWATWFGGTGDDSQAASIRVDAQFRPHLLFYTNSTNINTSGSGSDSGYNGGTLDQFLARFSADGTSLQIGTYIGGNGSDEEETHGLELVPNGDAYVMGYTTSTNLTTSLGAFQSSIRGTSDIVLAKIAGDDSPGAAPLGSILLRTYIGGDTTEGPDGIAVDPTGRVMLAGDTSSTNFPVTPNAYQANHGGLHDNVVVVVAADFTTLEYATYVGGTGGDNGRCICLGKDGAIYAAGGTLSPNLPVLRPQQKTFAGGSHNFAPFSGDCTVFKLVPTRDSDGDGRMNFDEFFEGTNTLDATSILRPAIGGYPSTYDLSFAGK